jgi:two-component system, sensor histidine kinase RpfC
MTDLVGSARALLGDMIGKKADPEYEMAINRVCIVSILYVGSQLFGQSEASVRFDYVTRLYFVYILSALVIFAHINLWPKLKRTRRVFSMLVDIVSLTNLSMHAGPAIVGFIYPAYLLIILGFGFRYGARWLVVSAVLSIVGVAGVVVFDEAWRTQSIIGGGLLVGLVIIPAYALQLVRRLWKAKAQAEESSRAKSMFIAAVSHDLRTPLNAIIGLGDVLAASKTSPEQADMARMIGDAGRSLLGQIDSILDLSRLEVGGGELMVDEVDLFELLCRMRDLLHVSAQSKGFGLSLHIDMSCPRRIRTSRRHVKDTLVNLVGNAIKFTAGGSVDICVRATGLRGGRARLRFEVKDTGIGISVEAQKRIFERFTQADQEIRDIYGGSGLGLAIARQLVNALGGEIGVESSEGRGSTFWFEIEAECESPSNEPEWIGPAVLFTSDARLIESVRSLGAEARVETTVDQFESICRQSSLERIAPLVLDIDWCTEHAAALLPGLAEGARLFRSGVVVIGDLERGPEFVRRLASCAAILPRSFSASDLADALFVASGGTDASSPEPVRASEPERPLSILVAEDNKTNQKVIAKMLAMTGRTAQVVGDGRAALDALDRERFDVVLMDINMPVIDGVEATRELRAREQPLGRRTPVLALTADVTPETRARCAAAGIDDCLTKPIDLPVLMEAIERWTGRRMQFLAESAHDDSSAAADGASQGASEAPPDLNHAALADLERLGGREFVNEIVSQFVSDAALLLKSLADAVRAIDVEKFRDDAHALRSCSANVGARSLYELCLSWRDISPQEFAAEGAAHVVRLQQEYERACTQLEPYLEEAA